MSIGDVRHSGPGNNRPVPEGGGHLGKDLQIIGLTSKNNNKPRPLNPKKNRPIGPSSPTTHLVKHGRRVIGGRVPDKHSGRRIKIPPKSSSPREQGLLGIPPHNGIDNGGLKPGVPGPPSLSSRRVGHGGGKSNLPPIPKNSLGKHPPLSVVSGKQRHLPLNNLKRNPHQFNGLPQRDPPRKLTGSLPKRIGGEPNRGPLIPQVGSEPSSPSLSNQLNRGPLISRHPPKPRKLLIHRSKRRRSKLPGSTIKRRKSPPRHLNHPQTV